MEIKTHLLGVGVILASVAILVAVVVTANNASLPSPEQAKINQADMELRIKREAQYQKCVIDMWPVVHASVPYDGSGKDPLTGRSFQEAYIHTVKDQVIDLCSARGVK